MMEMYEPCFHRLYLPGQFSRTIQGHDRPHHSEAYLPTFCSSTSHVVRWWISNIWLFERQAIISQTLPFDFKYRELATSGKPTKITISSLATTSDVGGTHHPTETFIYAPVSPSKHTRSYVRMTEALNFSRKVTVQRYLQYHCWWWTHRYNVPSLLRSISSSSNMIDRRPRFLFHLWRS